MTITDRAIEFTRKMDTLAEREFGEAYTLKTTFWQDGDFRIVAYNSKDIDRPGKAYVELWYQDHEWEHSDRALRVKTRQMDDEPRGEARQFQVGKTEWLPFEGSDNGGGEL